MWFCLHLIIYQDKFFKKCIDVIMPVNKICSIPIKKNEYISIENLRNTLLLIIFIGS